MNYTQNYNMIQMEFAEHCLKNPNTPFAAHLSDLPDDILPKEWDNKIKFRTSQNKTNWSKGRATAHEVATWKYDGFLAYGVSKDDPEQGPLEVSVQADTFQRAFSSFLGAVQIDYMPFFMTGHN